MRMSGMELALATGGSWQGGVPDMIRGICTDSRHPAAGAAFLALRGPHHDGHAYAAEMTGACAALIGDAEGATAWGGIDHPRLVVADTQVALGDIAAAWRRRLARTLVLAITGSYGKTTVRSMLVHALAALGLDVATNAANHNNLIGVPQTLLAVAEQADVAVVECGISEPGEMSRLAGIVQPDAAVLTGLGSAHGEGLGGIAGVIREKSALLAGVRPDGWCVLGTGVQAQLARHRLLPAVPCIAMEGADAVAWSLAGRTLRLAYGSEACEIPLALPAHHWAEDMALTATVAMRVQAARGGVPALAPIAAALAGWHPVSGRLQPLPGQGGSLVLDDSYNANPTSMQAALDTLAQLTGRRIAILGDMAELGADAAAQHAAIAVNDIDQLILVGPLMRHLAERHPEATWLPDTEAACRHAGTLALAAGDTVLVKASHGMRLDRIVAMLTAKEAADAV
jgi:UDP-N-acetylmuramoyl-tripeptide--D-alanyl-D-alanine ligase